MIPDPAPNTITRPYRGLSVQDIDAPLTAAELEPFLLGREVYRRTDYIAFRNGGQTALVGLRKASSTSLFSPVVEARVLAGPDEVVFVSSPETDVGNATALARCALAHSRDGARAYVVHGRYEHVNFIWEPAPVQIRVTEVIPPEPPKLLAMAEQAVDFDEDLPPIDLRLDAIDLRQLATRNPAGHYLFPCRGSGVDVSGDMSFLDTRPAQRQAWLMIGCLRSLEFHRHFYGDEPARVDICPARRADVEDTHFAATSMLTLTKCCILERGTEFAGSVAMVPWGSNLDEVRLALRWLTGIEEPRKVPHTDERDGVSPHPRPVVITGSNGKGPGEDAG